MLATDQLLFTKTDETFQENKFKYVFVEYADKRGKKRKREKENENAGDEKAKRQRETRERLFARANRRNIS